MPRGRTKRNKHGVAVRDGDARFHTGELIPAAMIQTITEFTGPIPPPEVLYRYDQVLPGLANRIATLAEGEAENRRAVRRRNLRFAEAGLASAFVLAMTVILGGIALVHEGSSREGLGSILGTLATLLVVYLSRGRKEPGAEK